MAMFRVVVHSQFDTVDMYNVFHMTASTGQESAIVGAFAGQVVQAWHNCVSDDTRVLDVTATDLDTHTQAMATQSGAGIQTGDGLPPQCSAVLSWTTAKAGRKYRGRTYVGGEGETQQENGIWIAGTITYLTALASTLRTNWPQACSAILVIRHAVDGTSDPVTGVHIRETVYTQRRRTVGQGA